MDGVTARLRRALAGPHPLVLRCLVDVLAIGMILALGSWAKSWAQSTGIDPNAINWNTLAQLTFTFLGVVFTAYMALQMAKAKTAVEETKVAQEKTKVVLDEVHTAVNSGKTIMEEKLRDLTAQVLALSKEKATLQEAAKGTAVVAAFKEGQAGAVTATATPVVTPVEIVNPAPVRVVETPPKGTP